MKTWTFLLCTAMALVVASPADAQTINPTQIQFAASPDHNLTVGATPVVSNYQLDVITTAAGGALAFTVNLAKPTPDASNLITANVTQLTALANGLYTGSVSAVGPGGATKSVPSDPFGRVGPPAAPGKPTAR